MAVDIWTSSSVVDITFSKLVEGDLCQHLSPSLPTFASGLDTIILNPTGGHYLKESRGRKQTEEWGRLWSRERTEWKRADTSRATSQFRPPLSLPPL